MIAPFDWLPLATQRRCFWALLPPTIGVLIVLQLIGAPLRTSAAPQGIVSFEFAASPAAATEMILSWGARGQVNAALSLGLDYLFLVLYSLTLALGCRLVATRFPLGGLGIALAWAQLGAGLLDAAENYALIRLLLGSTAPGWPTLAWWSAAIKFSLVLLGLLYTLGGGLAATLTSRR